MERLGGYITQGVSTVAGRAVDIIVVEQEDGSFRSTPWYVKFGKVLGVIKRTEKTVAVAVNGVETKFHMHLDSSGHACFLNDVESPEGEDESKSIVPGDDGCNGTNEVEGHYHDPYSQVSPLGGFVISRERKLAKKRLRQLKSIIGLVFRRKSQKFADSQHVSSSLKSRQKTSDRLAL
uniref:Lipin N-terminal domain-containing protein n=1 Tax=Araucaria cunninghamii TaxID=56994 RepID=A0A0D6R5X6_ARACU